MSMSVSVTEEKMQQVLEDVDAVPKDANQELKEMEQMDTLRGQPQGQPEPRQSEPNELDRNVPVAPESPADELGRTNSVTAAYDKFKSEHDRHDCTIQAMGKYCQDFDLRQNLLTHGKNRAKSIERYTSEKPTDENSLGYRRWLLAKFVDTYQVQMFVIMLICVNSAITTMEVSTDGNDAAYSTYLALEAVFAVIFNMELILKTFAFGFVMFTDPYNRFDAILIIISDITDVIALSSGQTGGSNPLMAVRVFRVFRVLRLWQQLQPLERIVNAFLHSIGQLANCCWLRSPA